MAGAYDTPGCQFQQRCCRIRFLSDNEQVSGIVAVRNGCNDQSFRLIGRQVLHGMHRQVHLAAQQRIFNLFGKKALAFQFVKPKVLHQIALRFDDDQFAFYPDPGELRLGKFCLPKGEFAAPRANF